MTFSLADQTVYFLWSLLFGVILSALYDFVRILRFIGFNRLWQIIVTDVLYFFFCAVLTVLFALPFNKGAVRYFVLLGEAVGFVVYRFTLGELTARIYCFVIRILSAIFKKCAKYLGIFLNKLLKANGFVVYNVGVIIHKVQNVVFKRKGINSYEQKRRKKASP